MKAKVGRPKNSFKYGDNFYLTIVEEHNSLSIRQMAEKHNVSISTVVKWIAKGRGVLNSGKQQQFKSK